MKNNDRIRKKLANQKPEETIKGGFCNCPVPVKGEYPNHKCLRCGQPWEYY